MKTNGIIFIAAFLLMFAGGYFFFSQDNEKTDETKTEVNSTTETAADKVEEEATKTEVDESTVSANTEAFNNNSCVSCHAVSSLGIEGGVTGPDLSTAFEGVEGKHGVTLDSFLQKPTSAVMSGVIEGNPLSDKDRAEIIEMLNQASKK